MNSPDFLQLLFAGALIGALTAYLAKGRGKDPVRWFFIGMFCGIFGLMALFLFPAVPAEPEKAVEPEKPVVPEVVVVKPWYYLDAQHNTLGPISLEALKALSTEQKVTNRTYIWQEGMPGWKRLEDLPDLQQTLQA